MKEEELKRFEEMADRIINNADKQQKEFGLRNLCRRIRETDPVLFDVAEGCGEAPNINVGEYHHRKWHSYEYTHPSYYIEAAHFFDKYENDTDEEHREREEQCRCDFTTPKYKVIKRTGIYSPTGYHLEEETAFDERWQYANNRGYYTFWRNNHSKFEYKLIRALLSAGYGKVENADAIEVLRRGGSNSLYTEQKGYATMLRNAEEELTNAVLAVFLLQALINENKTVREECDLYGLPLLPDQQTPQQSASLDNLGLTEEEQRLFERLTPFFNALKERDVEIKRMGKIPILSGEVGHWKFATQALCAYVGYRLKYYLSSEEGYVFISKLTGIDNKRLCDTYRNHKTPTGYEIVSDLLFKL